MTNVPARKRSAVTTPDLNEIIAESDQRIADLLRQWYPKISNARRKQLCRVVSLTAQGKLWSEIEAGSGLNWHQVQAYLRNCRDTIGALILTARASGESYRVQCREDEAHRRAVRGTEETVYFKGEACGTVMRFSDRLLELLLKADNPKYRNTETNINIQTNQLMQQLAGSSASSVIGLGVDISAPDVSDIECPTPPVPPRRRQ